MVVEADGTILPLQLPNGDKLPVLANEQINIIKFKKKALQSMPTEENDL